MFNFGHHTNELVTLGLLGLGLFAQNSELNLANNTTTLLLLLFVLQGQAEIENIREEMCCIEEHTGTFSCRCRHENGCHCHHNGNGRYANGNERF